jgi:hypothetical protein
MKIWMKRTRTYGLRWHRFWWRWGAEFKGKWFKIWSSPNDESDQSNKKKKNGEYWHGSTANGTGKRVVSLHLPNSGVQSVTVDDPVDGDISVDNVGQHSIDASFVGDLVTENEAPLTLSVEALATVSEATARSAVSYRSKRRAKCTSGDSLERASKLKATRNLDSDFNQGTSDHISSLCVSAEFILNRLQPLGFSFPSNDSVVHNLVELWANSKFSKPEVHVNQDALSRVTGNGGKWSGRGGWAR